MMADEIICIAPYFGKYNSYISNANGVRVVVSPDTETFSINFKELEEKNFSQRLNLLL